jgi:hypothetical protein
MPAPTSPAGPMSNFTIAGTTSDFSGRCRGVAATAVSVRKTLRAQANGDGIATARRPIHL